MIKLIDLLYEVFDSYYDVKDREMTEPPKGNHTYERKQKRIEHFEKNVKGWKQRPCTACNGSGYYDDNGSPKCGACNGTGKEMYNPKKNNSQKA